MIKCTEVSTEDYKNAEEESLGWCTECQEFTTDCCELDARQYKCDECDARTVFGAEEALLTGLITLGD